VPTLKLLALQLDEIQTTAEALQVCLQECLPQFNVEVCDSKSQIGSGALPTDTLKSKAVVIHKNHQTSADALARKLRSLSVPIAGRITQDALWLDCRVLPADFEDITAVLKRELPALITTN